MRGVVMSLKGRHAVLLTKNGDFVKIKNKNYSVGDTISISSNASRICAMAAGFLIVCGGIGSYFTPTGYISVDINPSLMLTVNIYNKVIDVKPLNSDAENILSIAGVKGKNVSDTVEILIKTSEEAGYINATNRDVILGIVSDINKLNIRDYENVEIILETAEKGELRLAQEKGVSIAAVKAIEEYTRQNGGTASENADKLNGKSVKEILSELNGTGNKMPVSALAPLSEDKKEPPQPPDKYMQTADVSEKQEIKKYTPVWSDYSYTVPYSGIDTKKFTNPPAGNNEENMAAADFSDKTLKPPINEEINPPAVQPGTEFHDNTSSDNNPMEISDRYIPDEPQILDKNMPEHSDGEKPVKYENKAPDSSGNNASDIAHEHNVSDNQIPNTDNQKPMGNNSVMSGKTTQEAPVVDNSVPDNAIHEPPTSDNPIPDNAAHEPPTNDNPISDDAVHEPPTNDNPIQDDAIHEPPAKDNPAPDNIKQEAPPSASDNGIIQGTPERNEPYGNGDADKVTIAEPNNNTPEPNQNSGDNANPKNTSNPSPPNEPSENNAGSKQNHIDSMPPGNRGGEI